MKLNTIVIARAFCKKVGIDRLKFVVTQGAFYNVKKPEHRSQSKLVWSKIRPRPTSICGFTLDGP
jgi:hypothetical protein